LRVQHQSHDFSLQEMSRFSGTSCIYVDTVCQTAARCYRQVPDTRV